MTVEKEWELLGVILGRMTDLYDRYLELLKKQRLAVVENRVKDMLPLHGELEILSESLGRLDQRRVGHMNALSSYAGKELLNTKDLVLEFPQLDKAYLESRTQSLKSKVAEVQRVTRSNVELIEISRSVVRLTMNTILTQNVDPRDKAWRTYGAAGGYARTVRREPVNLVNRRG